MALKTKPSTELLGILMVEQGRFLFHSTMYQFTPETSLE
jgi:hypothetical protein